MMSLELKPGIRPEDLGFTVTASVGRLDRWPVYLVDADEPDCRMLTGQRNAVTGSAALLGWWHTAACEFTKTMVHGIGTGKCDNGRAP